MIEVLIATSILMISVAALSMQASIGMRAANRTRMQGLALAICQSVLNEQIASGKKQTTSARPAKGFSDWMVQTSLEPLSDEHSWIMGSGIAGSEHKRLCLISVTAWQLGRNETPSKTTLSLVVRKPQESLADVGVTGGVQ